MLKSIIASLTIAIAIVASCYALTVDNTALPFQVQYSSLNKDTKKQVECLADNIYFESGYESKEGKIAVAFVTLNRMNSGYFPKDICSVVKQKSQNVCQFSWYCEEKPHRLSYTKNLTYEQRKLYNEIMDIAVYVYANYENIKDPTKGALFYHADYVNPQWPNMIKTAVIGRHIFYVRKDML